MSNILMYVALLSVSFFWGTSFAVVKIGLSYINQLELVLSRLMISAIIFTVALFLIRNRVDITIKRQDYGKFLFLSFLGITSYYPIQTLGINLSTTIHVSLIMATSPIVCSILAVQLGCERISKWGIIGIATAFCGVSLIILSSGSASAERPYMLYGDLLLVANSIAWGYFTLAGREIMQRYSPFVSMAYIFIIGTIMLLPCAFVYSLFFPLNLNFIVSGNAELLGALFYLGALCSVYSYYMWYKGVQIFGAINTSVFMYINPIIATITGILFLSEEFNVIIATGGIMVLFGVYLVNSKKQAYQKRAETK